MDYFSFIDPLPNHSSLFKPNYNRCITQVIPTMLKHMEISHEIPTFDPTLVELDTDYNIGINLMVDSLGLEQLLTLERLNSSTLDFLDLFRYLYGFSASSVFPTTTSTAIPSYHTGQKPIEHGIIGHRMYLPEIGTPIDTLQIRSLNSKKSSYQKDQLFEAGIDPQAWLFHENTLINQLEQQSVKHFEISHYGIYKSGLSHFYRSYSEGLEYMMGRGSIIQAFALCKRIIKKLIKNREKGMINLYFGELDGTSHLYGPLSEPYTIELRQFMSAFYWFIQHLTDLPSEKILLSITGDHGQARIRDKQEYTLQCNLTELKTIKNMYKTGRVLHCHVTNVAKAKEELKRIVPPKIGKILTLDETLLLLGGVDPIPSKIKEKVRQRIGELQIIFNAHYHGRVFETSPTSASDTYPEQFLEFKKEGSHGSLTISELVVPVLITDTALINQYLAQQYQ